jgi:3-oxoadipate enol-lactonase
MTSITDLHVEETGSAASPVVVWLGSLGSTTAMWDPQVGELGDRLRCLLVDLPGHGKSPTAPGPYTIAGLADGVVAALDRVEVERAPIVGLSIGAMIGMALAIDHPDRVDRLAVLCTSAQLGPPSAWEERAAMVRAGGTSTIAETIVGRWLSPAYRDAHPDEFAELVAMVSSVDRDGYAWCCEAIAAMDLRADLPGVATPTLVVAGALDPATPVDHGELIASLVPGARIEILEAAHLASWERAPEVNALLEDHLLGGGGGG